MLRLDSYAVTFAGSNAARGSGLSVVGLNSFLFSEGRHDGALPSIGGITLLNSGSTEALGAKPSPKAAPPDRALARRGSEQDHALTSFVATPPKTSDRRWRS